MLKKNMYLILLKLPYVEKATAKIRDDLSFDESIVIELNSVVKRSSLLFCIEVLPLTTLLLYFKHSCQTLKIYIQISKPKILLLHFLQVILMHTLSFDGWMGTQLLEVKKSTNFFPNWAYPRLSLSQLILNLIKNPHALILLVTRPTQ